MYRKMQKSGLTEISLLICILAILGQYPVLFVSWAPLGSLCVCVCVCVSVCVCVCVVRSDYSLMAVRFQVFFFLSALTAHQIILESCNHWWLWHPCLLIWQGIFYFSLGSGKTDWLEACMLNHFILVQLFVTLWTEAHQLSLSMGFSRQEYWSGLPCPRSGRSFPSRDRTCISCIGRQLLYH